MGRHGGRPSLKMNKLTVAEVRQISELPAENSALALRVSLVRTAARRSGATSLTCQRSLWNAIPPTNMALCRNLQLFAPRALFATSSPRAGKNRGGEGVTAGGEC